MFKCLNEHLKKQQNNSLSQLCASEGKYTKQFKFSDISILLGRLLTFSFGKSKRESGQCTHCNCYSLIINALFIQTATSDWPLRVK